MNWRAAFQSDTARRLFQSAVAGLALLYCLCASLYALPMSPAKLQFQSFLEEDFAPFFHQNWGLFAPDPINQDDILLVHCSSDPALTTPAEVPDEAWEDIMSPMWDLARAHRLSPWERLSRTLGYPVRAFQGNSTELTPWALACVSGDEDACEIFKRRAETMRAMATIRLTKLGTQYCMAAYPDRPLAKVGLRVRQVHPAPWSKRNGGAATVKDTDVGVFEPTRDVLPISFFVQRRSTP
jgi:hypothetical protein